MRIANFKKKKCLSKKKLKKKKTGHSLNTPFKRANTKNEAYIFALDFEKYANVKRLHGLFNLNISNDDEFINPNINKKERKKNRSSNKVFCPFIDLKNMCYLLYNVKRRKKLKRNNTNLIFSI